LLEYEELLISQVKDQDDIFKSNIQNESLIHQALCSPICISSTFTFAFNQSSSYFQVFDDLN